MIQKWLSLAVLFGCLVPMNAFSKDLTPQETEANLFFSRVLQETRNPLIAHLAEESLSKIHNPQAVAKVFKQQVVVPLLAQHNNSLAVPVLVNQKTMATFIVDTGASYTVITPALARKMGITISPDAERITIITANGPIYAPVVYLDQVAIGGVQVNGVKAIVQDLGNDVLLAGLLGMNFFKNMDLTIKQDKLILSINE